MRQKFPWLIATLIAAYGLVALAQVQQPIQTGGFSPGPAPVTLVLLNQSRLSDSTLAEVALTLTGKTAGVVLATRLFGVGVCGQGEWCLSITDQMVGWRFGRRGWRCGWIGDCQGDRSQDAISSTGITEELTFSYSLSSGSARRCSIPACGRAPGGRSTRQYRKASGCGLESSSADSHSLRCSQGRPIPHQRGLIVIRISKCLLENRFVRRNRGLIRARVVCQVSDRAQVRGSGRCGTRRIFSW